MLAAFFYGVEVEATPPAAAPREEAHCHECTAYPAARLRAALHPPPARRNCTRWGSLPQVSGRVGARASRRRTPAAAGGALKLQPTRKNARIFCSYPCRHPLFVL